MDIRTAPLFLAALNVEKANITTYKGQLGFGDPEIDESTEDYANLNAALNNVQIAAEDKQAVTNVKDAVYNGDVNEAVNPYPSFAMTALPFSGRKAGALSRYNNRKKRAKLAASYTEQIGIAMGYADASGAAIPPSSVKAVIEAASSAATGYGFGLLVSGRGESDMWEAQYRRKGSETWNTLGSATGKSADFTITPTTPGTPEQIEVRVILKKNNAVYGQPSDPTYVTLNP